MDIDTIYIDFGSLIKNARRRSELTQEALAIRVGLSRTSITNIEKGRQRIPLHMLFVFANALGDSPKNLLPDIDSMPISDDLNKKLLKIDKMKMKNEELRWVKKIISSGIKKGGNDE